MQRRRGTSGLGVALCVVLVAACQSPNGADSAWGPLAVASVAGGSEAITTGTVRITDDCVLLDEGDDDVLLVWPEDGTTWDEQTETITIAGSAGGSAELRDGDEVTLSGGGSSLAEDGLEADEFIGSLRWVSEPDRSCVTDTRWIVGDVVTPQG